MKNFSNNQFAAYLLVLIAFFVLLFITKTQYEKLQENLDTRDTKVVELSKKSDELEKLNALKNELASAESEAKTQIESIAKGYDDTQILEYVYSYAQKVNSGSERLNIRSLSIDDAGESDLGFKRLNVVISLITTSETTLFSFLNFLTSDEGTFTFKMSEFTYPEQKIGNIQVEVPLILYYQ